MVDIIVNSDYYKRKLIFTNTKNQGNGEIYGQIQLEIQERAAKRNSKFMFSISQMSTFQMCVQWWLQLSMKIWNREPRLVYSQRFSGFQSAHHPYPVVLHFESLSISMNFTEEIKLIPPSDIFLSEEEIGNFTRIFLHIESKRSN